jgi:hypothetical protein
MKIILFSKVKNESESESFTYEQSSSYCKLKKLIIFKEIFYQKNLIFIEVVHDEISFL